MTSPRITTTMIPLTALLIALAGCGKSSDASSADAVVPDYTPDTSYLDELAEEKGVDEPEPEPEPAQIDRTRTESEDDAEPEHADEQREWVEEKGSRSLFGRARDKAKETRDSLVGGTKSEKGLADTLEDEEYAQAAGFAWDMPEGWRMAVPSAGHFAEMFIQNPLGNASVVFAKTESNAAQVKRELQRSIVDTFGAASPKTSTRTVDGHKVTIFDLEGTYVDPAGKGGGKESPFYAIHAALIELPTTKVLIRMWGPQDTVRQNIAKFDAMIDAMYEK